ncbi:MAG: copper resistance CopC/CopD family protein [Longimicrobiaceae bacterium]
MRFLSSRLVLRTALLAALWSHVGPEAALAHTELRRAEPAADAVLGRPPTEVRLWFTTSVQLPPDAIVVIGPDGRRVDRGEAGVDSGDSRIVTVALDAALPGVYRVRWSVLSPDGHPVRGGYRFTVESGTEAADRAATPGTAPPEQPAEARPPPPETEASGVPGLALGRWLHLVGLALALGPLVVGLLAKEAAGSILFWRLWRVSLGGTLLLLLAAGWTLLAQGAALGGSLAAGARAEMVGAVLASRYGQLWIGRLLLVLLLLALAGYAERRRASRSARLAWAGLALGAPLLLLTSMSGHAATTDPVWLSVSVDWVHLAAAAAWVGGLIAFPLAVFPALGGRPTGERARVLGVLVPRFSRLALTSVMLLVLTGLYPAWRHVGSPAALASTAYGQTLLAKLLLVALILVPAATNRFRVRPHLAAGAVSEKEALALVSRFRRSVGIEAVLGAAILAAAALLVSLPPAKQPEPSHSVASDYHR